MRRALALVTAVADLATIPLSAQDAENREAYSVHQGGEWPESWPEELDPLRHAYAPSGRVTWTFRRSGESLVHYGMKFTTREEFVEAWPHLLKVKGEGAPLILQRGPTCWLCGAWHGVCIHTPAVGEKPLSEQELKQAPWKATNYIELFVDGEIVDLNRIALPSETPIIDERHLDTDSKDTASKEAGGRDNGDAAAVAQQPAVTPADTPPRRGFSFASSSLPAAPTRRSTHAAGLAEWTVRHQSRRWAFGARFLLAVIMRQNVLDNERQNGSHVNRQPLVFDDTATRRRADADFVIPGTRRRNRPRAVPAARKNRSASSNRLRETAESEVPAANLANWPRTNRQWPPAARDRESTHRRPGMP